MGLSPFIFESRANWRAALMFILLFVNIGGSASAEPFIPKTDDTVIEQLPGAHDRAARAARGLRGLLARAPNQIDLALRVARDEITLGRAEGDPRHYGRAEAALAPWLKLPDPPGPVLLIRATLLQNRHDFGAALADLDRLTAAEPTNAQAFLIRATVRQVEAHYDGAASDCRALEPLAPPAVASVCLASIDAVRGRGDAALATLHRATASFIADNEPDLALWSLTLTGESAARLGRTAESEDAFRHAVALGRRDVYLLGAYADFLLDQDRPAEVVTLLKGEVRVDPLLLRLAIAERASGGSQADTHVADLAQRFDTARRRGDTIHRREEARFQLALMHDPAAALTLAIANWSVQCEPADARILLEAANAAHQPSAAAPVLAWSRATGIEDTRIAALTARLSLQARN
jgi:tetratricopeptide (TPR) repeat protein